MSAANKNSVADKPASVAKTLRRARALIDTPEKWTQHVGARNASGAQVDVFEETAVCFCMWGALARVHGDKSLVTLPDKLYRPFVLAGVTDAWGSVSTFNDTHSHVEILAAFDRAIAKATRS